MPAQNQGARSFADLPLSDDGRRRLKLGSVGLLPFTAQAPAMTIRYSLLVCTTLIVLSITAQDALMQMGTAYPKVVKGLEGDLQLVTNGTTDASGSPVLMVMEGAGYKAVRLGADMKPGEELSLRQQSFDGLKWDAITSLLTDQGLHILFVSNGKKTADYGIGLLNVDGALSITGFHKVATFDHPAPFDPSTTTCRKTLPDLILFDSGAAYDQTDRLVASPDGQHFLVNHYTHQEKGPKKFWFACLDREMNAEWSGMAELPYEDVQSDVHQITLTNDGRIVLLTYVFKCADQSLAGDKMCHETHITFLRSQGRSVRDLLLDKDFVSSARLMPKDNGQLMVAMRYGSLTGNPGLVLTIDSAISKLKNTPLVDQRVATIHKIKLSTFGVPEVETGKKVTGNRATKVPDEVVELMPAWNGGHVLLEGFRDKDLQVTMGDAIAIRTLHGALRATYFDDHDSLRWQQTVDRAFMTTAGEAYGSAAIKLSPDGLLLMYNHTPGGLNAINASYADAGDEGKKKKDKGAPVEASELHMALIPATGQAPKERSLGRPTNGFTLCPMTMVIGRSMDKAWIKGYDKGTQHQFVEVPLR